jgi:hypothetical protein
MTLDQQYYRENFAIFVDRLSKHCDCFDEGYEFFAIDMAVQIRVLVHDTYDKAGNPISKSLFAHLGHKGMGFCNVNFVDSSFSDWRTSPPPSSFGDNFSHHFVRTPSTPYFPRYAMLFDHSEQDGTRKFKPLFGWSENWNPRKLQSFDDWKNSDVCMIDNSTSFTRWNIIETLCNKDGGAHYEKDESRIDSEYFMLKENHTLGVIVDGVISKSENIPLFPMVRQIAYEVLETLRPLLIPPTPTADSNS